MQLETHAKTCYNFYKISFIPLGTLVRYTDRKGGEAVEYSDHELVRGIKGGDQSALELLVRRWYPRITNEEFVRLLSLTATDLGEPWNKQGFGMLNVRRLLENK